MTQHQQSEPNAQPARDESPRPWLQAARVKAQEWFTGQYGTFINSYVVATKMTEIFCKEWQAAQPASEPSGREESLSSLEARLAADIRAIDGNHDKGAAELAEQLIARGWFSQSARLEASHTALQAKLDAVAGLVKKWRAWSRGIGKSPVAAQWAYTRCADELAAALAE
jgi:hypothetical protein